MVLRLSLQSKEYYFLCSPDEEMGPRVAKQFAPGHAVVTDPGAEPDVGWMPTLLFISFCLFLVVYSLIPKLLIRIGQ